MATYRIADIIVEMETTGRTLKQAEPYRIDPLEPQMRIVSNAEQLWADNQHLTLDDCEYISTGSCFYTRLGAFNGCLLHSSCVVVDDKAYLFSAPSGTGKSTHVQLWLKLFGDRAYVLNDDKPAIRVIDGKILVYGTPWSGKYDINANKCVELGGIAFVKRATENAISKMSTSDAMFHLLDQTVRRFTPKNIGKLMQIFDSIVASDKIYELHCNMDISAAKLSYETMSGKRIIENED